MTVSSSLAYKSYAGNGVTTAFATTYQFFDSTDLVVSLFVTATGVETLQTLTTHYTVSGGDGATGTVTMLTAPPTGTTLIIRRAVPFTQPVDYISNDSFPAETHEEALDRLTMLCQQIASRALSSPGLPSTFDPLASTAPTLPLPVAGKVLIGNAGATGWDNATLTDQVTINGLPIAIASLATGDLLRYDGAAWANVARVQYSNLQSIAANSFLGRSAGSGDVQNVSAQLAANILHSGAGFVNEFISGWTYARDAGDPTNDIAIAAGAGVADNGTAWLNGGAMVKRLDAAWAAGTGNGGLDTGAVGNNPYYIWAIQNASDFTVDYLFSLSATAPTMPSGYTAKRLIGYILRAAGANVAFSTYKLAGGGLEFKWTTPTLDFDLANTLTTSRRTDALKLPLNFSVDAQVRIVMSDNSAGFTAVVCCPDETDVAPSVTAAPLGNFFKAGAADPDTRELRVRTSAAGLIAARANLATVDVYRGTTLGFQWSRR